MKKRTNRLEAKTVTSWPKPPRKLGTDRNTIANADGFDAPLPQQIIKEFEREAKER
jgi:hypothetical protein